MRKILLTALVAMLLSCSKKADNTTSDTEIEYQFTANTSANYQITYTDENGNSVGDNLTGTTWSKKFLTNKSKGFSWAQFTVTTTTVNSISAKANIYINGKNSLGGDYVLDRYNASIVMKAVVFK